MVRAVLVRFASHMLPNPSETLLAFILGQIFMIFMQFAKNVSENYVNNMVYKVKYVKITFLELKRLTGR